MRCLCVAFFLCGVAIVLAQDKATKFTETLKVDVPHFSTDKDVKIDYDIVYVRAKRAGDKIHKRFFTDFSSPVTMEPGADLMLLHPDGKEELLVEGGKGSITDPVVSLDGQSVYYTHIYNLEKASQWNPPREGADIFKMNLKTRKSVRLTNQRFTPNLGAANWSSDFRKAEQGKSHFDYGVYNMGACPLPGGKIAFTSNRDGFRPAKGYPAIALQLFVMEDRDTDLPQNEDPVGLEKIGHLNLAGALHPVLLKDGRIMYSTLESQGARGDILWGIWTIHPDGTNWEPLVSAFDPGGAPNGFHFQAQNSAGDIIVEQYYNQNNSGFGAFIKLKAEPHKKADNEYYPAFESANMNAVQGWRYGRHDNGNPRYYRMPFMPSGSISLTPFSHGLEGEADRSVLGDKKSPAVGKFTHPSGAPENHLLTCYTPGPANHQYTYLPQIDGGIYLIKKSEVVNEPAQLRLIKNDPEYNECWPRAVVPYEKIYGGAAKDLPSKPTVSKQLSQGTPFGLIGTSSFYKRETYPNGAVPKGSVTGQFAGKNDPWKGLDAFTSHGNGMPLNWHNQGSDAGLYTNDDIHAVRILLMEPTTDRKGANNGRRYHNHAGERLRILGEVPLRKFNGKDQPLDPDGNPDTSFLAKIPADTGFTFQTLDKKGMVLNSAQTWHQLRPGEVRNNCGGCHSHSQKPTLFEETAASKGNYEVWDLTKKTPLLTDKARDTSTKVWDSKTETGLRYQDTPLNIEYWRDVKPILQKSCVVCHTGDNPAGKLNLDADDEWIQYEHHGKFPGTYLRLAMDERAKFGHKPIGYDSWGYPNASRYVRKFQSRRSLLTWKVHGERMDGFSNDDHPSESEPGSGKLFHQGKEVDLAKNKSRYDLDYTGSQMPPPEAVKSGKVKPLTDEDKRTLARWIDLGCPIDLDFEPKEPSKRGFGWMLDDQRPTLTASIDGAKIFIGMYDYGTGLNTESLSVTSDIDLGTFKAGTNLAKEFKTTGEQIWTWTAPATAKGTLTVSVADKQGNLTKITRKIK